MGKVEDLRAIKDARFAAAQKVGAAVPAVGPRPTLRAAATPAAQPAVTTPPVGSSETSTLTLCGHRAIGGKTCIRERGHDEASHKYAKA